MKRAIGAVLCLLAPAAWGQTTINYSFAYVGSYTPAGLATPVDVWTLTQSATDEWLVGAVVLDIGADYMGYGGNPFQVGIQGTKQYFWTPTIDDANAWLATETFAFQSDSHFLFGNNPVVVIVPSENNDGSLGTYVDPYGQTEVRGLGGLRVAQAVPVAERVPVMDLVRVGVPRYSAVYFQGQLVNDLGRTRYVEGIQLPMTYRNTWQGSGTGGQTSTNPDDPTVQWNQPGNWSRGVLPGLGDDVRIELSNPGRVAAASGTVGSVWVNSSSSGGAFSIPTGADLGITGSLIVGTGGTAAGTQSGLARCTVLTLGEEVGSYGAYELTDGRLTVEAMAYVGKEGRGAFTQTGGTLEVNLDLHLGRYHQFHGYRRPSPYAGGQGTYRLQGGQLTAGTVGVGYSNPVGYSYNYEEGTGLFHQTAGSLLADYVGVGRNSRFLLAGGDVRAAGESVRGAFIQNGGKNTVTQRLTVGEKPTDPARYELRGGTLRANEIVGPIVLLGGAISVQTMGGTLVNDGGVIAPGSSIGMMSLGGLVQNSGTLQIELAALGNFDKVWIADSAKLGGVLDLRSMSDYRPREGDSFPIITVTSWHPGTPYYQGDFAAITSDITTGLGGGAAFGGGAAGQDYRVTFLGCTNGDANGDHIVDGGDLALVGRNWIQAGKGWADADFNGNGQVEGGDLALLQGNWTWELPAAPPPGVPLPEPAAGCLIGLGAMVLLARRRGATARRMGDA